MCSQNVRKMGGTLMGSVWRFKLLHVLESPDTLLTKPLADTFRHFPDSWIVNGSMVKIQNPDTLLLNTII
jgi:hypothetical protein